MEISEEEDCSEDSRVDDLMKPVFCLDNVPAKLTDVPRNGLEYLRFVMDERRKHVEVAVSNVDSRLFAKNRTYYLHETSATIPAPEKAMPSKEWQLYQVADFSDLRQEISRLSERKKVISCQVKIPIACHLETWNDFFSNNKPLLSVVMSMTQAVLDQALEMMLRLIKNAGKVEPFHSLWLYSLMACLKLPLLPDMQSTLRNIAQECSQIRHRLPNEENIHEAALPVNLIICIIARYFHQMDLADEPNNDVLEHILNFSD